MIFITDIIRKPLDEGGKVGAFNLIYNFQKKYPCEIVTVNCNLELPFATKDFRLNKLLFGKAFYEYIKVLASDRILYIPSQSITLATFVRAKLLACITSKQVSILSLQPVKKFIPLIIKKKIELRKKYSLHAGGKVLLHVGSVNSFRGIETLMEAVAALQKDISDVKLVVVGRTGRTYCCTERVSNKTWSKCKY